MRRKTTQEKKQNGTFNITRDKDRDFKILDGLLQFIPEPPKEYSTEQIDLWNRVWRHLTKHQYGKESDMELVNSLVFEWFQYLKYRTFDHTAQLAQKALQNYKLMSDALCLNPNALGRATSLQKQPKGKDKEQKKVHANLG